MSKKSYKKSVIKSTSDDSESESKEEVDVANMCFMVQSDVTHKVKSESTLDDAELTFDDLALAFEDLQEQYRLLKIKHIKLKKDMIHCHLNLILFLKKENISISHIKIKKNFDLRMNLSC